MSASISVPKRGRPPKFGRPAQLVTLTLPEDVVAWLTSLNADLGWAIVKLYERSTKASRTRLPHVAELVQLPGQRALILVRPEPFKNLKGISIIPLADGRGFLALDAGRGVSDLELAVIDRLDGADLLPSERDPLTQVRSLLKQWRQEGVRFESRSIVVAHRRRPAEEAGPLAALRSVRRGHGVA